MNPSTYTVFAQAWEESERGWGVRPDGASLHRTLEDCKEFRRAFWEKELASQIPGVTPDCYSRTVGVPQEVAIDEELYEHVAASEHGIWISDVTYNKLRGGT